MTKAAKKPKHIPERMCICCRKRFPKDELLRLAADAQGLWHADPDGRAGGRGAYLCSTKACVERVLAGRVGIAGHRMTASDDLIECLQCRMDRQELGET